MPPQETPITPSPTPITPVPPVPTPTPITPMPDPSQVAQPTPAPVPEQVVPQPQPTTAAPVEVVAPVAPAQTVQPVAPVTPIQLAQPAYPAATVAPKQGKAGLIIAAIVGLALLLIALVVVAWLFVLSPQAQTAKIANTYIKDITSGKVDEAIKLASEPSSEDTQAAVKASVAATKGTAKLSKTVYKDGKRYSLYTLSNSPKKNARVTVSKEDGKWVVSSYVYSNSELALIPGSSAKNDTPASSEASTSGETNNSQCLANSDFNTIEDTNNGGNGYSNVAGAAYAKQSDQSADYTTYTYFLPNKADFDPQDDLGSLTNSSRVTSFATFYKAYPSKAYTIHIYGVVASPDKVYVNLSNQRAQKIKDSLLAQGVPESKIVVEASQNIDTYNGGVWKGSTDPVAMRLARSVPMIIVPDKTCLQ